MRRTCIAALAVVSLALAGCSSSDDEPGKPKSSKTLTVDAAEQGRACIKAWMDTIESRPDDFDPETDEDPEPDACSKVPDASREDMYMDALERVNEEGQEGLRDCLDDPSCTRFPVGG
ncbi:hypothetical protein [Streptomyces sp. AN091965]|uniref:hypothetical protein n=1 Tax=Streptomyces sp. AN091965 TaxID=2927803 RepID=UPI001F6086BE|nr:hypothetical protein [Streptomyces sp. AN091965]MCI3929975.1 hypothetical protein [Streptomyces sp. AN091965]